MNFEAFTIEDSIDTVTLYLSPNNLASHVESILQKLPRRVLFNPGTEDAFIKETFENTGIETVEGCTLVMLRSNQFDF